MFPNALTPTAPGTHILGPVTVEYLGSEYQTPPLEVKVRAGGKFPSRRRPPPARSRSPQEPQAPVLEGEVTL